MNYNYFSTPAFSKFKEALGFRVVAPYFYLGAYKQKRFLNWPIVIKIVRKFFSQIEIDVDMSLVDKKLLAELINRYHPYYVSGTSFSKLEIDGFNIKESGTFILDLNKTREELWQKMDYSLRKQIKKGERLDLVVKRVENIQELKNYYDLLKSSRKRVGFRTLPFSIFKKQWGCLYREIASCYEVFACYNQSGELLAGLGLIINPDSGQCMEVAVARAEKAAKLPAGDFLKWNMIKWIKNQGLKYFDLAGVNSKIRTSGVRETPDVQTLKEINIYRYKAKWGGDFYPVYHYEKYR